MADFDFLKTPPKTVPELWRAVVDLLPQLKRKVIRNYSVGTTSTAIAHGLGFVPQTAFLVPQSDVRWWRTSAPTATHVFYAASAACVCDVEIVP